MSGGYRAKSNTIRPLPYLLLKSAGQQAEKRHLHLTQIGKLTWPEKKVPKNGYISVPSITVLFIYFLEDFLYH